MLRAVIEEIADIERAPASPGEREAAHIIAGRFQGLGLRAEVEDEPASGSYAWPVGAASAVAATAGLIAAAGPRRPGGTGRGSRSGSLPRSARRAAGALGGALAAAGIVDDISLGRQAVRLLISPRRTTCNVVGYAGDQDAERTLVVMAHHDAAPSGIVFDQRLERWLAARYPDLVERMTENPPVWWPVIAGPALVAIGSALPPRASRSFRATGMLLSAIAAAAFADIGLRRPVPGANDNLSAVAVLVALAQALIQQPPDGLRVILFSAGAEEALQQGARGFARRHFPELPGDRTAFLNLDTVGSGRLVLLDGEGPVRMERYHGGMNELVARCADELGIFLHRGLRSRSSTDGVVPMRAGYPAATLVSVDDEKMLPNYHLYSDTPDNVDYRCVADAARLAEAVIRAGGVPLE